MQKYILQYISSSDGSASYPVSNDAGETSWQLTPFRNNPYIRAWFGSDAAEKMHLRAKNDYFRFFWPADQPRDLQEIPKYLRITYNIIAIEDIPKTFSEYLHEINRITQGCQYILKDFQKLLPQNQLLHQKHLRTKSLFDFNDRHTASDRLYYLRKYYEWLSVNRPSVPQETYPDGTIIASATLPSIDI